MDEGTGAERDRLAREFTDELHEGYRFLARTTNYRAKQFLEMVTRTPTASTTTR